MDLRRAPQSDFTENVGDVNLESGDSSGHYSIRVSRYVRITGDNRPGEQVFNIPLDPTIDPIFNEMCQGYERYTFADMEIQVECASPLGSSSGGIQMAHIPDPENTNLSQDPASYLQNLDKLVRQDSSLFIRPRDSENLPLHTNGTMYTKRADSPRWSSFGAIVGVVRSTPDGADYCEYTITLMGTGIVTRTAMIEGTTQVTFSTTMENVRVVGNEIRADLGLELPVSRGRFVLTKHLRVKGKNKEGTGYNVHTFKHNSFEASIDGKTISYKPNYEPLAIKSYHEGNLVFCHINALADNVKMC